MQQDIELRLTLVWIQAVGIWCKSTILPDYEHAVLIVGVLLPLPFYSYLIMCKAIEDRPCMK